MCDGPSVYCVYCVYTECILCDGPSVYCASQGVGHFAWALGVAFEAKLLKAVFPLLAAAASHHSTVSDAAMATLERVCAACAYPSLRFAFLPPRLVFSLCTV